jgi:predicted GNAT superfamily acetyltransferase
LDKVYVKEIDNKEDFKECEKIQRELPQLGEVGVVPAYLLELTTSHGGLTLGLYMNEHIVGFSFSVAAYTKEKGYYLFSDSMGFYKNYQRKSLGFLLKQVQYQVAKEKGAKRIYWTYDPLLGPNANINIRKVGGMVHQYELDRYSLVNTSSGICIPADRFLLDWSIQTKRVENRMIGHQIPEKMLELKKLPFCVNRTIPVLIHTSSKSILVRENAELFLGLEKDKIAIEIPLEYFEIREAIPELAQDWRMKTRELFHHYINRKKYVVTDFVQINDKGEIRNFYLLSKPREQKPL